MYIGVLCILILLLPVCVNADSVYQMQDLSEKELLSTYATVMADACRQADSEWHEWSVDKLGGYWGDGVSDGNEGIRAIGCIVLTCGTLLKYSDALTKAERRQYMGRTRAAVRYAVLSHVTGTQTCVDGKKWGGSWQSAYWAATLAFGAWFVWDDLGPDLQQGVERVIASEADRFLSVRPPTGRWNDTKAEENGWDMICISIAANMFPTHPHAAAWREKATEYMMNVLSAPQDLKDTTIVDGRPVNEWISAENLHPDFTLENHGVFHPSYVQCSSYFLTQATMHYVYAGHAVPQAASHHLMDTWRMFESILLPWGETAFPQGMDWELHGLPPTNLFASLATRMQDGVAASMEKKSIQYMRQWQTWCGGSLAVPGSRLGFTRHAIQAEQTAYCYLAHRLFGPAAPEAVEPLSDDVRHYSSIGVLIHRTEDKFVSFSWKYRIMGQVIPLGVGGDDPFFTIPITDGFVGSVQLVAGEQKMEVVDHTWKRTPDGFDTRGTVITNGNRLQQRLAVTSIGKKTVVYQDRVVALKGASVLRELGVPIGIENDQVSGGKRVVSYQGGSVVLDWQRPQPVAPIAGKWANIDGRLGVVVVEGSGLAYAQASEYNPQGVYADVLYGSYSDARRGFRTNDEVCHRVALFFTDVTSEQTAAISESVKIDDGPNGKVIRFKLPEGGDAEVAAL